METAESTFGISAGETILFVLRSNFKRNPFEVLWEKPKAVYDELEKIFGDGTKVLINIFVKKVNEKTGLNADVEEILKLMRDNSPQSLDKFRLLLKELVKCYTKGEEE